MQGAAGELGDALAQTAQHVIERQKSAAPELHLSEDSKNSQPAT